MKRVMVAKAKCRLRYGMEQGQSSPFVDATQAPGGDAPWAPRDHRPEPRWQGEHGASRPYSYYRFLEPGH
ncbi:MAG TPA: hypothetical protein P5159_20925, partial [Phycisphaerae bacterium]|nr:hypothetical protein [Phycisphaerae bacterium]